MWPLVGRDRELASIGELFLDGSTGGVVVAGAPGVGKTRLAVEAARVAGERGVAVVWARATGSAASMPLGAFAALLPAGPGGGTELLAWVRWALAERAEGRRLLLCVDDGHLLDDASAALVHLDLELTPIAQGSDDRTPARPCPRDHGPEDGRRGLKFDANGEPVWLELNPQGQFLFVEGLRASI